MRAPLLVVLLLLSSCSSSPTPAPATQAAPPSSAPAALDEGSFKILLQGEEAGEETFRVVATPGGGSRSTAQATWKRAGAEVRVESELVVDAAFRPESGKLKRIAQDKTVEMTLTRKENNLELVSSASDKPIVDKEPSDVFIQDRVLSHWGPLCSLAATTTEVKKVRVFPDLELAIEPARKLEVGGRELNHHVVESQTGSIVDLVCDGPKLILLAQPQARLVAYRPGQEKLASDVARAQDPKPDVPAGVQEVEREVKVQGGVLACSLMSPADRRSTLPSVVMLNGTGPQDRDEDSPGGGGPITMAFFKHLAIAMAQAGIASLRCDDRGVGKSQGPPAMTLEAMTADALAQVGQLRAEPGLDPKRVGIVGHSEGGTIATLAATADPNLRALVLLATMGRSLDKISLEQRETAMRQIGMSAADIKKEQDRYTRAYAAIKSGKPLPTDLPDTDRQALEPLLPYLASHFRHDVARTLRKLDLPVLVAQGGKDFHVSMADAKALADALRKGGNKRVVVKDYPELSHMFAPVKTGTLADYSDPSLAIHPAFIGDVITFLEQSL